MVLKHFLTSIITKSITEKEGTSVVQTNVVSSCKTEHENMIYKTLNYIKLGFLKLVSYFLFLLQ